MAYSILQCFRFLFQRCLTFWKNFPSRFFLFDRWILKLPASYVDLRKYSIKGTEGRKSACAWGARFLRDFLGMYEKLMIMDEVKEVYRDRSVWRSVPSDFPTSNTA